MTKEKRDERERKGRNTLEDGKIEKDREREVYRET
jgi:hypothetical protein